MTADVFVGFGSTIEEATVNACEQGDAAIAQDDGVLVAWGIEGKFKTVYPDGRVVWTVYAGYDWKLPQEPANGH